MRMFKRDEDGCRVIQTQHYIATYMGGGYWALTTGGTMIACWITKHEVRKQIISKLWRTK